MERDEYMSWDRFEYDEIAKCRCGKGKIVRHMYEEEDDWNRSRGGCTGEEIQCPECSKRYRIEHLMNYKHDGIIEYDRVFLVPQNMNFPQPISERSFYSPHIEEEIVASFPLDDIKASANDMIVNRYTTRLRLSVSKQIVSVYYKRFKRKDLSLIVPILNKIITNYDSFEWTVDKITEYRQKEKEAILENNKAIELAISNSFELNFSRGR